MKLTAGEDDSGRRLDRILRKSLPALPLSRIHRLIREGKALLNGRPAEAGARVRPGDIIETPDLPESMERPAFPAGSSRQLPGLNILWEGHSLLILNKPAGLPVHGKDSLDSLVQDYLRPARSPSLSFRPGPLHRLDQGASGAIVFSKTLAGARWFSGLLQGRRLVKRYLALVEGAVEGEALWEDHLLRDREGRRTLRGAGERGAKPALTRVRPLAVSGRETLLEAVIETGRTHQIRAQAGLRGHPLRGDVKYGGRPLGGGFSLHAWELEFPGGDLLSGEVSLPLKVRAPLPAAFLAALREEFGEEAPF